MTFIVIFISNSWKFNQEYSKKSEYCFRVSSIEPPEFSKVSWSDQGLTKKNVCTMSLVRESCRGGPGCVVLDLKGRMGNSRLYLKSKRRQRRHLRKPLPESQDVRYVLALVYVFIFRWSFTPNIEIYSLPENFVFTFV